MASLFISLDVILCLDRGPVNIFLARLALSVSAYALRKLRIGHLPDNLLMNSLILLGAHNKYLFVMRQLTARRCLLKKLCFACAFCFCSGRSQATSCRQASLFVHPARPSRQKQQGSGTIYSQTASSGQLPHSEQVFVMYRRK